MTVFDAAPKRLQASVREDGDALLNEWWEELLYADQLRIIAEAHKRAFTLGATMSNPQNPQNPNKPTTPPGQVPGSNPGHGGEPPGQTKPKPDQDLPEDQPYPDNEPIQPTPAPKK